MTKKPEYSATELSLGAKSDYLTIIYRSAWSWIVQGYLPKREASRWINTKLIQLWEVIRFQFFAP
jgi:hypothetical protein